MTVLNKASEIAELLTSMLSDITVANGWLTDIGTQVYRGKRNINDDQPPCCVLIEGEDRPQEQQRKSSRVDADYAVVAYLKCHPDNPNDAAHLAIKDIKRRLFSDEDGTLGERVKKIVYKGRDIGPRADGVSIVMAVVHVTITFAETLADA